MRYVDWLKYQDDFFLCVDMENRLDKRGEKLNLKSMKNVWGLRQYFYQKCYQTFNFSDEMSPGKQ